MDNASAEAIQLQIDTVERCYYLISNRGTVFDAGRQLMGLKSTLEMRLREVNAQEAPTRRDIKVIR